MRASPEDVRKQPSDWARARRIVAVIVAVATVAATAAPIPLGSTFARLIIALALAVGCLQAVEVFEWKFDRRCASYDIRRRLKRALVFRVTCLAGLILVALLVRSPHLFVIASACLSLAIYTSFWRVKRLLRNEAPNPEKPSVSPTTTPPAALADSDPPDPARRTWFIELRSNEVALILTDSKLEVELKRRGETVKVHASEKYAKGSMAILGVVDKWRLVPAYAAVFAAVLVILTGSAFGLGAIADVWIAPRSSGHSHSQGGSGSKADAVGHGLAVGQNRGLGHSSGTSSQSELPDVNASTSPPSSVSSAETSPGREVVCPSMPYQSEAKEPLISAFVLLYEQSMLTLQQRGCLGHIVVHHSYGELWGEMNGTNPYDHSASPLTYSIVSERFGGVLVRWDISKQMKRLVAEVGPVGGVSERYPRHEVKSGPDSAGEFYLLKARGHLSYLFARRSTAEEWVKLSPTEARAFAGRVHEVGWVWPSAPVNGPHGTRIIRLLSNNGTERPAGTITLEANGEARRGVWGYPMDPAKEVSLSELVEDARR